MNGDGGQGEAVRVPLADGTLVTVPGSGHSDAMLRSLLTLSDVMATGHHAAVCAGVEARATRSPSSATAPSACPACWRPSASARSGSSPCRRHADRQALAQGVRRDGHRRRARRRGRRAVMEHDRRRRRRRRRSSASAPASRWRPRSPSPAPGSMVGIRRRPARRRAAVRRRCLPQRRRARRRPRPSRVYIPELLDDVLDGAHRPRPRPRLRDRPRRHRRRVRRDGRAPRHQVTRAAWGRSRRKRRRRVRISAGKAPG